MVSKINLPTKIKMLDRIHQLHVNHCEPCTKERKGDMIPCRTCPVFRQIREYSKLSGYVDEPDVNQGVPGDFNRGAWSIEEEDYLMVSYKVIPIVEISKRLNRSKMAIRQKHRNMRKRVVK